MTDTFFYVNPPALDSNNASWMSAAGGIIAAAFSEAANGTGTIVKTFTAYASGIGGSVVTEELQIAFSSSDGHTGTISSPTHQFADIVVENLVTAPILIALGLALETVLDGAALFALSAVLSGAVAYVADTLAPNLDQFISFVEGQPNVTLTVNGPPNGNVIAGGLITGGLATDQEVSVAMQGLVQQSASMPSVFPQVAPGWVVTLYNVTGAYPQLRNEYIVYDGTAVKDLAADLKFSSVNEMLQSTQGGLANPSLVYWQDKTTQQQTQNLYIGTYTDVITGQQTALKNGPLVFATASDVLTVNYQGTGKYIDYSPSNFIYKNGTHVLAENGQNDIVDATDGNERIIGSDKGNDIILGGAGDTVDYSRLSGGSMNIDLNSGIVSKPGTGSGNDLLFGIKNVIGSNGKDTVTGDNINFTSQSGADQSSLAQSVVDGTGNTITLGSYDALTVAAGANETSFQDTVDASKWAILSTDTVNFEGQSIAGSISSGATDTDGRQYTFDGSTLTIKKGSDALTIKNFVNGDYGVNITYGNFTMFSAPGTVTGLNDSGVIVGTEIGAGGTGYGFTYQNGTFGTIPQSPFTAQYLFGGTQTTAINNNGQFAVGENSSLNTYPLQSQYYTPFSAGYIVNGNNVTEIGYDVAGFETILTDVSIWGYTYQTFPETNAAYSGTPNFLPTGINDSGVVVGNSLHYGFSHPYIYAGGQLLSIGTPADFNNSGNVTATGINDSGTIVGGYTNTSGNTVNNVGYIVSVW